MDMTESNTSDKREPTLQQENHLSQPEAPSGKNIILCSDGTGNRGGKGDGTNVWRIYNYIDLNSHQDNSTDRKQISYYEDGVGTEDFKLFKLIGGAFGWGLSRNIQELYDFLIKNYEEGDSIYLFGFSRGAFTVRSLAGLIEYCGIPENKDDPLHPEKRAQNSRELRKKVKTAYRIYKNTHKRKRFSMLRNRFKIADSIFNVLPRMYGSKSYGDTIEGYKSEARLFKEGNSIKNIDIHFIGVWDTVSAIGMPFDFMRWLMDWVFNINFHSHQIGPSVKYGYHCLSIDDERHSFHPQLWDETKKSNAIVEQVWFSGVHSNVGGGYPKRGMAHEPLYWMMNRAKECGLILKKGAIKAVRDAADVSDKMYDSRAGTGVYYRYLPRNIEQLCADNGLAEIKVHASVFDRIILGVQNYAPGFLPANIKIVTTESDAYPPEHTEGQINSYQALVKERAEMREPVLHKVNSLMNMRRALYFLFVAFNVVLVYQLISFASTHANISTANGAASVIQTGVGGLIPRFLTGTLDVLVSYFQSKPLWGIGLVATPVLLLYIHRSLKDRMIRILTGYWWNGADLPIVTKGANQPKVYRAGSNSASTFERTSADDPTDQPGNRPRS